MNINNTVNKVVGTMMAFMIFAPFSNRYRIHIPRAMGPTKVNKVETNCVYGITRSPSVIVLPRTRSQNGIIPNAATVLTKVIVIDRLISPLSRRHQKFDPVPPGQQPRTLKSNLFETGTNTDFQSVFPPTFEF